jgi:divalent metal cation (Fe/Co/Zn/Cd) transporter
MNAEAATIAVPRWQLERRSRLLLWITVTWNTIEGFIAVGSGIAAGSVALVGFGLDSGIEVMAASVLIWRLRAADHESGRREHLAHRVVGVSFLILAAYVLTQAAYTVVQGNEPEASTLGFTLAVVSLTLMPLLGLIKRRNATRLGSRALLAESSETLICSYLSLTLVLGLGANAAFGWWWADIAAALAMVPWIVKEGLEGLRGESCAEDCA